MASKEITLGNQVQDVVSGLKGTATAFLEALSGTKQVGITPPVGKDRLKGDFFDAIQVKYIGRGPIVAVPADDTSHIVLGDVYEDVVTGFVGTATLKLTYMTGCVSIALQPKVTNENKDGKLPEDVTFNWKRLKRVGAGPTLAKPVEQPARKGGPVYTSGRCA